ncbi:MAG TPA: hypothetical protein VF534_27435 [Paraburkholderia sp.]
MSNIYGALQPLTGAETVTVQQTQNGQIVTCTMTLSSLSSLLGTSTEWAKNLDTNKPSTPGVVWNDAGSISIS